MGRVSRRRAGTRRVLGAVLLLTVAGGLAGCDDEGEDERTATSSAPPPTAEERLAQAQDTLLDAGSLHLLLEGTGLPEDRAAYIITADGSGTMDPPAFEGTITAKVAGVQADVPTIAVDGELYVQLPFTPGYVNTPPDELGVPDPARLFDTQEGLVTLLTDTQDPEFGEETRSGREVLQQVSGTLPGAVIGDLLYLGDDDASFEVTYGLLQEDEQTAQVRSVEITGPFYPDTESTYTVTLDQYGEPVTVTAP